MSADISTLKSRNSKRKTTTKRTGAHAADMEGFSPMQLMQAIKAFEQGDFSVADTVNARQLLGALRAYEAGDFSVRLPQDQVGIAGEIARTFNMTVARHKKMLKEFERINQAVGKEGKLSQRAEVWNSMAGNSIYEPLIRSLMILLTQLHTSHRLF
ncbi:MAG: hypothetical protein ACOH5I_12285 [Oligoflexus sp.]